MDPLIGILGISCFCAQCVYVYLAFLRVLDETGIHITMASMSLDAKAKPKPERQSQACDICKLRHQKCNAVRPSCHQCQSRDLQCNYSPTRAHRVNQSAKRRKCSLSESTLSTLSSPASRKSPSPEVVGSVRNAQDYRVVRRILTTELVSIILPLEEVHDR